MDKGWIFIGVLPLAGLLGFFLKQRFLVPGKPARDWYDARIAPWIKKGLAALFYLTIVVWIAVWAFASEEDRNRLSVEVKAFMKSIEFGDGKVPQPDPAGVKPRP
ncbi:MAG: hypothetical protein VW268_07895 [Rhodospirillaceae bacterium]